MSRNRIVPYGIGKFIIQMRLDELPKDIHERLIELHSSSDNKLAVKEDTEEILICGSIQRYEKKGEK